MTKPCYVIVVGPFGVPNLSGSYRLSDEQTKKIKAGLGADEVIKLREGETTLQKYLSRRTLDREDRQKKSLIETFTNQLYAYFLRRKQEEQNYK